jgi:hypothetical protein
MTDSAVASATYTIQQQQQTATPTFSPAAGTYTGSVTVSISDATTGATIHYTTDGSTPTTASPVYSTPLTLTQTTTVKAMATASGMTDSAVTSATFTIQQPTATPTFSPAAGTYTGSVSVRISDATSGATIYYTTDGSTPTPASPIYSSAFTVTQTTTVKAMAAANGMTNSGVASATYTIQTPTPSFSPAAGTYSQPQSVTIGDTAAGATIRYTTDGTTPTASSPVYSGPISVTRTTTINAIAFANGMTTSAVASATYTLQAAQPTFDPPGGNYLLPQSVSIADASAGVTIYYTTDGTTPTTSSQVYSGPIFLVFTTTIKAMATAPGWTPSVVATSVYKIGL